MGVEDEYEGGPDQLAEKMEQLDEVLAEQRAEALRAGLEDFDLDEEDAALLAGLASGEGAIEFLPALPVVAIVGRPNVGKSALVNRILGRREAVVEDTPGVTRDRVTYKAEWLDRRFSLVDTGGWEPDARGIDRSVAAQAEVAIDLADIVLFVVDATVGATSTDEHVVKLLRKSGKPVFLIANKVDDARHEPEAAALWNLGLGEPHPVSAIHGRGVADLLDEIMKVLPEVSAVARYEIGGPRRVAILGRPNVGKSSLLNKAAGEERVVVNELAGTTRDPVDEVVELGGKLWTLVDTAGIRRRVHLQQGADFYASLRTSTALEKSEVAVVVIDVSQPISVQDLNIIDLVLESGRALVLAFNKWDRLNDDDMENQDRRRYLEREIEQDLAHVAWAPRVNISARTGRHLDKLVPALETALESWDTRIPTGKFNAFLSELVAEHPHPLRGGKQPRILFGTQAATRPPTFVLFTTGFLDPGYRRFIQRRLREIYGFDGTPIVLNMRIREKRQR
ncbi:MULTISPECIES: ribosome biogenesis GTPase Der [unclassified Microbacterium]|uniref:ribosome biogenesis GTPase Der n=1 Tax=unclassified Microbacterium TaxID=2609290 RepID=UPI0006F2038C|nr:MULTISPECIES: ribosome biogenesis GTPase Der [unclassified Microbacterium]AOX44929.1 ribosome biogenesis GTPase Der [Microbacterium sp. BH-3-3-3]KQR89398.1 ribosome-associated GTPase EngA [Microbacterium sp. Leaf179]KQT74521.1 ribosome-associated GTPase EngA [Microbacterium sp. Leaf436]MBD8218817.1 ribosome biogenesis GTPase Der [Microbacterium sp. CFBP 13617]MBD8479359.1 ribosome biogenesis GTPase Der [Microbacterium sp. CFBP 8794]